jgi:hypothetical protein
MQAVGAKMCLWELLMAVSNMLIPVASQLLLLRTTSMMRYLHASVILNPPSNPYQSSVLLKKRISS